MQNSPNSLVFLFSFLDFVMQLYTFSDAEPTLTSCITASRVETQYSYDEGNIG